MHVFCLVLVFNTCVCVCVCLSLSVRVLASAEIVASSESFCGLTAQDRLKQDIANVYVYIYICRHLCSGVAHHGETLAFPQS